MIAIVDSSGANIASIVFALQRLGFTAKLTTDPQQIQQAHHVILPGVGAAQAAMQQLEKSNLIEVIKNLTQPVLGICLGMQLLYQFSEEGDVPCLGIIPGKIKRLNATTSLPVPHMGWNRCNFNNNSELFKNIGDGSYFYFVHSYAAPVTENTLAITEYSRSFAAAVQHNNFFATQFHPERSGEAGAKVLQNFLNI